VPPDDQQTAITRLLARHSAGDRQAFDELVPLVYDHLRRIARGQLARLRPTDTVSPTALVHEAYLQLSSETGVEWQDRGHFYAICARAMRRILVDHARRRGARKRGHGSVRIDLDAVPLAVDVRFDVVLAVEHAMEGLETLDPRLARLVECRFFAGMTEGEAAAALGVSVRTAQRDWLRARAWLLRELEPDAPEGDERP